MSEKNPIKALVLIGGKSLRMGQDKSLIKYKELPQWQYLVNQFENIGLEVFISKNETQTDLVYKNQIIDRNQNQGPFQSLISAFQDHPNTAWLVVACDMPHVNMSSISELIKHRNPEKLATAFYNENTQMPDPFFTIWEEAAFEKILESQYFSPKQFLNDYDIELIKPSHKNLLLNVNTPEQLIEVKSKL